MNLNLNSVTGYQSRDKVIEVKAQDGRTLYHFLNPSGKRVTFNLPVGHWLTSNNIEKLKRPLKYLHLKLPAPTRRTEIKEMSYEVGDNPNKCSIDTKTGKVLIDYSINAKDIPFVTFILFHETAHFFYKGGTIQGESLCDFWAAKQMLRRGYNPSQIYLGQEFCLSERSKERKDNLYYFLKKVKCIE